MATSTNPDVPDLAVEAEDDDPEALIGELLTEGDEADDIDISGLVR